jgi:hypothetical protein
MIKLRDMAFTLTWMGHNILDTGKKTSKMEREKRHGLTEHNMRATISSGKNMDKVPLFGPMGPTIRENSYSITSRDMVNTAGQTVADTVATGETIKWKEQEFSLGLMADAMKVSTSRTRSMVLVPSTGQMEEST